MATEIDIELYGWSQLQMLTSLLKIDTTKAGYIIKSFTPSQIGISQISCDNCSTFHGCREWSDGLIFVSWLTAAVDTRDTVEALEGNTDRD